MPEKKRKLKLGMKNLAMLPSYFNYIFVHLRQKARLRPEIFVNFRPKKTGLTYNSVPMSSINDQFS